jgi:hypothetical protein
MLGAALGTAALAWWASDVHSVPLTCPEHIGPAFSDDEIEALLDTHGFSAECLVREERETAVRALLERGATVGLLDGPLDERTEEGTNRFLLDLASPASLDTGEGIPWIEGAPPGLLKLRDLKGLRWTPLLSDRFTPVLTPFDAYRAMMLGACDALILGQRLVYRADQPLWEGLTQTASAPEVHNEKVDMREADGNI